MSITDVKIDGTPVLGYLAFVRAAAPALCRQASEHGYDDIHPNHFDAPWLEAYGGVRPTHSYAFGAMIKKAGSINLRWTCDGVDHEHAIVTYDAGSFTVRAVPELSEQGWCDLAQRLAAEIERQHGMSHDINLSLLAECRRAGLAVRGDS